VAPSQFYRNKLIEWGWAAEKVVYIPNFSPADWEETPVPEAGGLLYFGRLSEEKGVGSLIRAAAASGVAVVIAGRGPEEPALRALAASLSAPVEFAGFRSGPDLAALFHRTRAVVLPSEWYENAPMSVLEAHSAGRPVLGADIGGIPELIRDGETGWIFKSGDVDGLAGLMTMVAGMPSAELSMMGSAGGRIARSQFSEAAYLRGMTALYASLGVGRGGRERDA
jgi:glycosyltransferase involved in cell wall biosynthesis